MQLRPPRPVPDTAVVGQRPGACPETAPACGARVTALAWCMRHSLHRLQVIAQQKMEETNHKQLPEALAGTQLTHLVQGHASQCIQQQVLVPEGLWWRALQRAPAISQVCPGVQGDMAGSGAHGVERPRLECII